MPPNGLVVYCGEIITAEGKPRKINIDFEPFKPINTSLYLCDNKFHTEALSELLESDQKFGFIIMDGNGRWAKKRMLPRAVGHKKGVEAVRNIVRAAGALGLEALSLCKSIAKGVTSITRLWLLVQVRVAQTLCLSVVISIDADKARRWKVQAG